MTLLLNEPDLSELASGTTVTTTNTGGAVSLRGSSFPTGANSATASLTLPAATATDDLIVVVWITSEATGTFTDPAGYTLVCTVNGTANNQTIRVFKKRAVAGDASATVSGVNSGITSSGIFALVYYSPNGRLVDIDNYGVAAGSFVAPGVTCTNPVIGVYISSVRNASTGTETWATVPAGSTLIDKDFAAGGAGKAWAASHNLTIDNDLTKEGGTFVPGGAGGTNAASVTLALYAIGDKPNTQLALSGGAPVVATDMKLANRVKSYKWTAAQNNGVANTCAIVGNTTTRTSGLFAFAIGADVSTATQLARLGSAGTNYMGMNTSRRVYLNAVSVTRYTSALNLALNTPYWLSFFLTNLGGSGLDSMGFALWDRNTRLLDTYTHTGLTTAYTMDRLLIGKGSASGTLGDLWIGGLKRDDSQAVLLTPPPGPIVGWGGVF